MSNLPKVYRILLGVFVLAVVLQLLFISMVVMPKREELANLRDDATLIQQKLRGSKWPMDPAKLEQHISELQLEIDGGGQSALSKKSRDALSRCQETFMGKLRADYGNVADFMRNASRMDYRAEFNRVTDDCKKKGILLDPSVLRLSEESSTQYIYQPLIQLWTVEKLLDMAQSSGLEVANDANGRRQAALVSVKPMKAYFKNDKATRPYMLEFPIDITVIGTLDKCIEFIDSLNGQGVFLPPGSFEIFALPPVQGKPESDGKLKMRLVCSSFLADEKGL